MASSAPLFYCYSPQFLGLFNAISTNNNPTSSSSNPFSPPPYSSYTNNWYRRRRNSQNLLAFSGLNHILMNQNDRAQAMSTSQGNLAANLASPRNIVNMEDRPDHLLVLVHGILASPSDWTYFDVELKRRLGKKFLIYGH